MFQSTHPRGVRLYVVLSGCSVTKFQSTHPRGVRPGRPNVEAAAINVSIHAPAWGATRPAAFASATRHRFNPRTRVGCDDPFVKDFTGRSWFQSTHPRGVRRLVCLHHFLAAQVSIHAPAWGATRYEVTVSPPCARFNPRTRVGCDDAIQYVAGYVTKFQSTHPRGVRRHSSSCKNLCMRCFNPRTRVGGDAAAASFR